MGLFGPFFGERKNCFDWEKLSISEVGTEIYVFFFKNLQSVIEK